MLCAENEGLLLPTVLSRMVKIKTNVLPADETARILLEKRPELTRNEAVFYANLSGGSVGRAIELSEPDEEAGKPKAYRAREALLRILQGIADKSAAEILLEIKTLDEFKDDAGLILDLAGMWYRDIAVWQIRESELCNADIKEKVVAEAVNAGFVGDIGHNMRQVEKARERLAANAGFQLTIEVLMLNLGRKIS